MRKPDGYKSAKSGSLCGTAAKPRAQAARVSQSFSRVVLLEIDSEEPSDAMMAHIATVVDQSLLADDSI